VKDKKEDECCEKSLQSGARRWAMNPLFHKMHTIALGVGGL
jgi:hypothetical protein